jgi:hypothetical protein
MQQFGYLPVYALEMHANNDSEAASGKPGWGTFLFVPDEEANSMGTKLSVSFAEPDVFDDNEDPLKVLAASDAELYIWDFFLKEPDYLPLGKVDDKGVDPLLSFASIFEKSLPEDGAYAGYSIVFSSPDAGYDLQGRMEIRNLQDVEYEPDIGILGRFGRIIRNEPTPEEEVDRLAGYRKQQLDLNEKAKVAAIEDKILKDTCFLASIRVYSTDKRVASLLVQTMKRMGIAANSLNTLVERTGMSTFEDLIFRRPGKNPFLLSSTELAGLWHPLLNDDNAATFVQMHHATSDQVIPAPGVAYIEDGSAGDIAAKTRELVAHAEKLREQGLL